MRHRLTDRAVKSATSDGKLQKKLSDGDGLYLLVRSTGAKWWRFNFQWHGKPQTISLGIYDDVSLSKARQKADDARRLVHAGQHPTQVKKHRQAIQRGTTVSDVAAEWLEREAKTDAPKTTLRKSIIWEKHVKPSLGPLPIGTLEPVQILDALRPLDRRGTHETAHRAKHMIGQILRYAVATGRAARDVSADVSDALTPVTVRHYPSLTDPAKIGALLRAIDGCDGFAPVCAALKLAPYVFVRPGELRLAEWMEIDLDGAVWRIPAQKMKMREAHLVPLARQSVQILTEIRKVTGDGRYVFPSARTLTRPMSDGTLNAALRRLGYAKDQFTAHGFRAMARTILDERLRIQPDVIEIQLAHVVRGPLGATYNRSRYWEERVQMMQTLADYLDTLRASRKG